MTIGKTEFALTDIVLGLFIGGVGGLLLRYSIAWAGFRLSVLGAEILILGIIFGLWASNPAREEPPLMIAAGLATGTGLTFLWLPIV